MHTNSTEAPEITSQFLQRHSHKIINALFSLGTMIALLFSLAGCAIEDEQAAMPGVLKIGILPEENKNVLIKRYTPLFEYLSNELNVPYELDIPADYNSLLEKFINKEVDLAHFGGFTFIQAHHQSEAVPLIMRDIDIVFTSYFITQTDTPESSLKDFKGKTFSFGSRLSTSGHLMPRHYLKNMQIEPETFFSNVTYSGAHDTTAFWVKDGITDLGVVNGKIVDKMLQDGRLNKQQIKIIWESPPYPDYVWALQSRFNSNVQTKIREAFLSLNPANKEHAEILRNLDAGGYLPASLDDFSRLNDIAIQLGLLKVVEK